jgi:MoxR-like ATPase
MATPTPGAQRRQNLRDALRRAFTTPGMALVKVTAAQAIIGSDPINNLSIARLEDALRAFGIDPATLTGAPATMPSTSPPDDDQDDGLIPPPDDRTHDPADSAVDDASDDAARAAAESAAIEAQLGALRAEITQGGFAAFDDKLRELVIAARKPPVIVHVPVEVPAVTDIDRTTTQAAPTARTVTWKQAFSVKGALGAETCTVWDGAHPDTPSFHPGYVWPDQTVVALTQMKRKRNVYLFGPAGAGKTEFAQQIAARLGRPFVLISCDASTDAATLVGMTVPDKAGGVTFQPGQLVRAIQTPGAVICIDEPSIARPGALFVFQNVLTPNRALFIQETGQRIKVASGVSFIATDNTNGTGGGARKGFHGTQPLNAATLDRFGVRIRLTWLDAPVEAKLIANAVSGCTIELATLLVQAATTTRQAAGNQVLTEGIGLRRLFSWAELLVDGIDPETAFQSAIENCVPETEREALRQQCVLSIDRDQVRRALNPQAAPDLPPPSMSRAAADFDAVSFKGF